MSEGQQINATATITGDSNDLAAAVTYLWQTSSDGGQSWTNAGPGITSFLYNSVNNTLSSVYSLGEGDEGKLLRVQASFTDDTGQLHTATSAPTSSAVVDVAPAITAPFSYAVDELSIVKNGTQIYDNTFTQAPPNSPALSNGVTVTPTNFFTLGSIGRKASTMLASRRRSCHPPVSCLIVAVATGLLRASTPTLIRPALVVSSLVALSPSAPSSI